MPALLRSVSLTATTYHIWFICSCVNLENQTFCFYIWMLNMNLPFRVNSLFHHFCFYNLLFFKTFSSSSGIRFIRNITKSIQHSHTVSLFDHMKTNANCLKQKKLRVVISLIISCFSWVLTLRRGNILYSGAQLTQQCTQKLKSIQTAHVLEWFWCASEVEPLPRCR